MRLPKKPPQFHNIVVVSVHIITRKLTAYTTNKQTKSKRYVGGSDYSTKVPRAPHVSTCTRWDDDPSRYIWVYSILQQQGHNGYRWRREWCVGGCGDILPLSHASTKWLSSSLFHKSSLAQLNLWRSPALHPLITRSHVFRTARDVLWQPCGSWATVSAWFVFWDVSRIPSSTVPCLGFRLSGAYSSGLTQACDCEVSPPLKCRDSGAGKERSLLAVLFWVFCPSPMTFQTGSILVPWWWLKYIYTGGWIYSTSADCRLTFSSSAASSMSSQSELGFRKEKGRMLKCLLSWFTCWGESKCRGSISLKVGEIEP